MEEEIKNDQELYSYFRDRNTTLCKDNFTFLMNHPEVKRLLNDYLSNILLHKPDDVFKFTRDYFKFLSSKGGSDKFVILVGPNSVGKTTLINKLINDFKDIFEIPKYSSTEKKDNHYEIQKEEFMDNLNKKEMICYSYNNLTQEYDGLTKEEIRRINKAGKIALEDINEELMSNYMYTKGDPDPDLIIRTAGEVRMSGFLAWQGVYSEMYFTDTLWPDFNEKQLDKAIEEFNKRKRNFGK